MLEKTQKSSLQTKKCRPYAPGTPPLAGKALQELLTCIDQEWKVDADNRLQRLYPFKTYLAGIEFVNRVALLAEAEDHHPLLIVDYAKVTMRIWTHTVNGLSENDFILAAKTDALYSSIDGHA